ncbi:MAG: hypothetical protein ACMVO3_06960 [Thalassobaculum sp.]|jgi:hypothetical protein
MRTILACLLSLTFLAGCAGENPGDIAVRWLGNTALAACEAVPNCSTVDTGGRRRD